MSASFYRSTPNKQPWIDSLLVTPPSLERLCDLLKSASIDAGWAANVPSDELLEEAEASMGAAYLALQSYRGAK